MRLNVFLLMILITAAMTGNKSELTAAEKYRWKEKYSTYSETFFSSANKETFGPDDKKDYTNKIMNYVISLDPTVKRKIKILRINSRPETDYLFLNNRLFCVLENWNHIPTAKVQQLTAYLNANYGNPQIERDANLHIYSYKTSQSKVVMYQKHLPGGTVKCKIYFYTKKNLHDASAAIGPVLFPLTMRYNLTEVNITLKNSEEIKILEFSDTEKQSLLLRTIQDYEKIYIIVSGKSVPDAVYYSRSSTRSLCFFSESK
jgi:hypothetical protein